MWLPLFHASSYAILCRGDVVYGKSFYNAIHGNISMNYKFNIMKMHSKLGQGKLDTNVFLINK